MSLRMGMHGGPVIVDGARIFGDTVNLAARMAKIAQGGQIVTTSYIVDRLPKSMHDLVREFDVVKVKGKQDPIDVYDLLWRPQDLTTIQTVTPSQVFAETLTLNYRQAIHRISPDRQQFVIGRSTACDLVVAWRSVSRNHVTIEFTRGRFVLSDISTNGTHVRTANGETLYLRRESLPMWGKGQIALGAAFSTDGEHMLDFDCG